MESHVHPLHTDLVIVAVRGEVDVSNAARLRERLAVLLGDGAHHLILDMSGVTFLDSNGLSMLVGVRQLLCSTRHLGPDGRPRAGTFALAAVNPRIREVLRITGFTRYFPIYSTAELAIIAHADQTSAADGGPSTAAQDVLRTDARKAGRTIARDS